MKISYLLIVSLFFFTLVRGIWQDAAVQRWLEDGLSYRDACQSSDILCNPCPKGSTGLLLTVDTFRCCIKYQRIPRTHACRCMPMVVEGSDAAFTHSSRFLQSCRTESTSRPHCSIICNFQVVQFTPGERNLQSSWYKSFTRHTFFNLPDLLDNIFHFKLLLEYPVLCKP